MISNRFYLWGFLIWFLGGCEDPEIQPKEFPFVLMGEAIPFLEGVNLSAEVMDLGERPILSHGFAWGTKLSPTIEGDFSVEIPNNVELGPYGIELNSGLVKDQGYFVRPFIKTGELVVYGTQKLFTSEGSLAPTISDFTPKFGPRGTQVRISGKNFGYFPISYNPARENGRLTVHFGELSVPIQSLSDSVIEVQIPKVDEPMDVSIFVENPVGIAEINETFQIYFPWVSRPDLGHLIREKSTACQINTSLFSVSAARNNGIIFNAEDESFGVFDLPEYSGEVPQSFAIGGKSYFLLQEGFWEYDPFTAIWEQKADFPGEVGQNNVTYAFGSENEGFLGFCALNQELWSYSPASNSWTRKTDFPINYPLIFGNSFSVISASSVSLDNSVFLKVETRNFRQNSFWEYQLDSDSWQEKATLGVSGFSKDDGFLINGKIFFGPFSSTGLIYVYDPLADEWDNRFQPPPSNFSHIANIIYQNRAYIFDERKVWIFDPSQN